MTEREIKRRIQLVLTGPDVIVMDNPSGVARHSGGAVVPYGVGLCHKGGSDLIGILRAADGRGIFLAPEIKSATGRQRDAQRAFEQRVLELGGEYALLRSAEDARRWLTDLRRRHG